MMLDDFFTLSEMNNGLTIPSRVKELVDSMVKERDSITNNVGEATRQWSAVACAIAATDNQDCLSLFIHLDGLHFIEKWLKDALIFETSSTDSRLEESIVHLLQALGKLCVDYGKLVSSEILLIVKGLLVHNSSKVQEKAQMLFETWEKIEKLDTSPSNVVGASTDEKVQKIGNSERDTGHSVCELDGSTPVEASVKVTCWESTADKRMSASFDALSPSKLENTEDSNKIHARAATCTQETTTSEIQSTRDMKHSATSEISPDKGGITEGFKSSDYVPFPSSSAAATPSKSVTLPSRTSTKFASEDRVQYPMFERIRENVKKTTPDDHLKNRKLDLHGDKMANSFKFMKSAINREHGLADKRPDIDVYGIVDPLEVARQVAIEVQREMVDYRDESCSSSEKQPEDNETKPYSPDSVSGRQSKTSQDSLKVAAYDTDMSDETSQTPEESASSIENLHAEQANEVQDMDNSLVTEESQEANAEKPLCNFDLNQELSSEDAGDPDDQFLAPVSVVSASRAAAATGLPVAPLQFEGNLGWKGSAATSAFRPASLRRMPENDRDLSSLGSSMTSKQRQGCLDIDLNVLDTTDGRTVSLLPDKNFSIGECSIDTSQIRAERFKLDLNYMSEDSPSDLHIRQFPWGNDNGQSRSSSSSIKQQPSLKTIDLNDRPSFFNDISHGSKAPQTLSSSGGMKSDDSVISIMGTRVKVNQKEFVSPNTGLMQNGQTSELAFDISMGRSGSYMGIGSVNPYTHHPSGYSYQNIASGSAMPFPSTIYAASGGPIPYMVDSRGAPVIPQIISPSGFSQTPFFINMPNLGPSNVTPMRNSFDLESGTMVESRSRGDPGGFTQFLNLGQVRPMHPEEQQLRSNPLPTFGSYVNGKRKETENPWEQYPYKHHPWK